MLPSAGAYQLRELCRCCGSRELRPYLDLGRQPLANAYHQGEEQARYPLSASFCPVCCHSQLDVVVDPAEMFTEYHYSSSVSATMRENFAEIAEEALRRRPAARRVLDVGCNSGALLEQFMERGCEAYGVDMAANWMEELRRKRIHAHCGAWGGELAESLPPMDVITGTNVFAHVDDAAGFLAACQRCLAPDGILILEFPSLLRTLEMGAFDTYYHEHLSYFSATSAATLFDRCGFRCLGVRETPGFGGSLRWCLSREAPSTAQEAAQPLIEEERQAGLSQPSIYTAFARQAAHIRQGLRERLSELARDGYVLAAYGASAKGNTLLNYCQCELAFIADDAPSKQGRLSPGRGIPIVAPARFREEERPAAVLMLSWNVAAEISRRLRTLRPPALRRTELVYFLPQVRTCPLAVDT